uniref:Sensory transduction histidine kinase n=1 Tax=Haliea sp. ETY-M TaxID=1055105 RepID=A0A455R726_9GAMM|nr:sensory transduction histidine kinase [Haliea sp. ETY-M]
MTLDEAARYLAVSKTTLRRWTNNGTVECRRVGKRNERRFERAALDRVISGDRGESSSAPLRQERVSADSAAAEKAADLGDRHICLYLTRTEERWEAFRPFFFSHYRANKPTVYLHSESSREDIRDHLESEGIDLAEAERRQLFVLVHASDSYLRNGTFSPSAQLSYIRQTIVGFRKQHKNEILITGEMDWFFTGRPGVEDIHQYEERLNALISEFSGVTIVCQYDLSKFSGLDAVRACCSHPTTIFQRRKYNGYYGREDQSALSL